MAWTNPNTAPADVKEPENKTLAALKAKAKPLFEKNEALDVLYGTGDIQLFYTKNDANNHIVTEKLKDKEVHTLTPEK